MYKFVSLLKSEKASKFPGKFLVTLILNRKIIDILNPNVIVSDEDVLVFSFMLTFRSIQSGM